MRSFENLFRKKYAYETIPLRVFMQVSEKQNVKLLIQRGYFTKEELVATWEEIIRKNAEANGSMVYMKLVANMQTRLKLTITYILLKAACLVLSVGGKPALNEQVVNDLRERGYVIDLSSTEAYTKSLEKISKAADALSTRIMMKNKEIQELMFAGDNVSFDKCIASLSLTSGFEVSENIRLAQYNERVKMLKRKTKT